MTGSSDMDNIIISGVRIYFPPGNELPTPSSDMITFAVLRDTIPEYVLLIHKKGKWEMASPHFYKETAHAISAATRIAKNLWK